MRSAAATGISVLMIRDNLMDDTGAKIVLGIILLLLIVAIGLSAGWVHVFITLACAIIGSVLFWIVFQLFDL